MELHLSLLSNQLEGVVVGVVVGVDLEEGLVVGGEESLRKDLKPLLYVA